MTIAESASGRVLGSLSALWQRPLSLVDGQSPEAIGMFAVRLPTPRLSVISSDGKPFSDSERRVLLDIFDLVRENEESDARFQELEQRMLGLQRENLDLTVKNRNLSDSSTKDTLTGLYTRWYVMDKIDSEINRSLRHGSPMAVLMMDIDHFKNVNDSYGHSVGDQVLQSVGRLLRDSCRVYDVPGRYGGEEFCIVLPGTPMGNTAVVAERIRERLEKTNLNFGDVSLGVTASIGIAGVDSLPEEGVLSPSALIDRADRALYSAKNRGRNRVEYWRSETTNASESMTH